MSYRCTGGLSCYNEGGLIDVTTKTIEAAIQWLEEGQPTSNVPLTNNLVEAMTQSITSEGVCVIYLIHFMIFLLLHRLTQSI